MTFDEEMDGFDPLVAEKFELLDRVRPIGVPQLVGAADQQIVGETDQQAVAAVDEPIVLAPRRDHSVAVEASRSRYLLAAAAAIITVAGVSVLALVNMGNDPNLEAGNNGGQGEVAVQEPQADDAADEAPNKSLTVEGSTTVLMPASTDTAPQDTSTTVAVDDNDDGDAESADGAAGEAQNGNQGTVAEGPAPTVANVTETESTTPATSATTVPPTSVATEAPETSLPPTTAAPVEKTDLIPGSSWLNPPTAEKMISVRGTVMEVFTDCQSRLILNDLNEVESIGPVSCDGGSYIVVEGTRIMTASGYMMSEADMYGKHLSTLRPGQQVTVTAVPTASAGGMLTLNCVLCQIKLG